MHQERERSARTAGSFVTPRRPSRIALSALVTSALFAVSALPASAEAMTLTFVRHAQSWANVYDVYDSSIPGPPITPLGEQEAEEVATALSPNAYDAIYVSPMLRTQLTAAPLAEDLLLEPVQLTGLREIEGGIFEDQTTLSFPLALYKVAWILGNRYAGIPGSIDGNEFERQMDQAVQAIFDSGAENAVAFSHQGTIETWVAMNVKNPDFWVMLTHSLPNTGTVVITGSPEEGWTLVNWNGIAIPAQPTLPNQLIIDTRTLITTAFDSADAIWVSLQSLNPLSFVTAVGGGVVDVTTATATFAVSVTQDLFRAVVDATGVTADQSLTSGPPPTNTEAVGSGAPAQSADSPAGSGATERDTAAAAQPSTASTSSLTELAAPARSPGPPAAERAPAAKPERTEVASVPDVADADSPSGATDLTDGNKTAPGDVAPSGAQDRQAEDASPGADDIATTVASTDDRVATDAGSAGQPASTSGASQSADSTQGAGREAA